MAILPNAPASRYFRSFGDHMNMNAALSFIPIHGLSCSLRQPKNSLSIRSYYIRYIACMSSEKRRGDGFNHLETGSWDSLEGTDPKAAKEALKSFVPDVEKDLEGFKYGNRRNVNEVSSRDCMEETGGQEAKEMLGVMQGTGDEENIDSIENQFRVEETGHENESSVSDHRNKQDFGWSESKCDEGSRFKEEKDGKLRSDEEIIAATQELEGGPDEIAQELENLEDMVMEKDKGKSAADYSRRAEIFEKSAEVFVKKHKDDECKA